MFFWLCVVHFRSHNFDCYCHSFTTPNISVKVHAKDQFFVFTISYQKNKYKNQNTKICFWEIFHFVFNFFTSCQLFFLFFFSLHVSQKIILLSIQLEIWNEERQQKKNSKKDVCQAVNAAQSNVRTIGNFPVHLIYCIDINKLKERKFLFHFLLCCIDYLQYSLSYNNNMWMWDILSELIFAIWFSFSLSPTASSTFALFNNQLRIVHQLL